MKINRRKGNLRFIFYGLEGVTLHDPLVDHDLGDLQALDGLEDGRGLGSGFDTVNRILDLGGGPDLRIGAQEVRHSVHKGSVLGGALLSGLGVAARGGLVVLLKKLGGIGLQVRGHLAIGDSGQEVGVSMRHFFVSFLVFKSFVL